MGISERINPVASFSGSSIGAGGGSRSCMPRIAQAPGKAAPHAAQKRLPLRPTVPQLGHSIRLSPAENNASMSPGINEAKLCQCRSPASIV